MSATRSWCGRLARTVLLGLALPAALPEGVATQETATLEGRVFDARTGQVLDRVRLSVLGQRVRARTDDSGFYRLRKVPPGLINLRIERQGYAVAVEQVAVGGVTTADFTLFSAATVLDAIVVEGRRPADSSAAGRQDAASSGASPGEMVARVPGARVIRLSGQVGAGTAIQLRGIKSFVSSGDPVIYVDGVRVADRVTSGLSGRFRGPTALDLIDPGSIDRIEVLPGAAAAAMYGEGASNGVILIYTKKGGR
ncbi:MAG: TonB-dependent receptor plug domain-containing protein [Gemmatimonadetes bacterium]|nr:TonB-dependent receptor plug domain-containing protein [Gemmatimonadota bacterium]